MVVIEIRRYVNRGGIDVVGDWLVHLEDLKARARIAARLDRLSLGNFGDCILSDLSLVDTEPGEHLPSMLRLEEPSQLPGAPQQP